MCSGINKQDQWTWHSDEALRHLMLVGMIVDLSATFYRALYSYAVAAYLIC